MSNPSDGTIPPNITKIVHCFPESYHHDRGHIHDAQLRQINGEFFKIFKLSPTQWPVYKSEFIEKLRTSEAFKRKHIDFTDYHSYLEYYQLAGRDEIAESGQLLACDDTELLQRFFDNLKRLLDS